MKIPHFLLLLFLVMAGTAIFSHFQLIHQAKNQIGVFYNNDKSKSISYNRSDGQTQLMLNFHGNSVGGRGLLHAAVDSALIKVLWLDDDHLQISYPRDSKIYFKEDTLKFFNQYVFVKYLEN